MKTVLPIILLLLMLDCGLLDPHGSSRSDPSSGKIIIFNDIKDLKLETDAAIIEEASVKEDSLTLKVAYSGGCKKHVFVLYGSSAILKSNPPQAELFLSHDANEDMCEAYIHEYLHFDLLPLKKSYQNNFANSGPLLLRIYAPGLHEPFTPLLVYAF